MLKIILCLPLLAFANNEDEFHKSSYKYLHISTSYNKTHATDPKPLITYLMLPRILNKVTKHTPLIRNSTPISDEAQSMIEEAEKADDISDRLYLATTQIETLINRFYDQYLPNSEDVLQLFNTIKIDTQNKLNKLKTRRKAYIPPHLLKSFKLLKYKMPDVSQTMTRNEIVNAINSISQITFTLSKQNSELNSKIFSTYTMTCTKLLDKNKSLVIISRKYYRSLDLSFLSTYYICTEIISKVQNIPANTQHPTAEEKLIIAIQNESESDHIEKYRILIKVIMKINSKLKSKIRNDKTLKDHAKDVFRAIFSSKKPNKIILF